MSYMSSASAEDLGGPRGLATVSVVDALGAALRERILDGSYPPGAPVAEVDVARDYRVSRPTAKTAIRKLVNDGLLRHEAHRPAYVPRLAAADIADLFYVRTPLELAAVRTVAGLPDTERTAHSRRARESVRDLRTLPAAAPHSRFVELDLSFHRVLVDAAASPRMARLFATLGGEIHLCMVHTRRALGRDRIGREHGAIVDAVAAGDPAGAERLMRSHLDGARAALIAASA